MMDELGLDMGQDRAPAPVGQGLEPAAADISQLSFKQASEELESIVRLLESNQLELEDSLKAYERGVILLKDLQTRLDAAEQKVTVLLGEIEPDLDTEIDTRLS